MARNVLIALCVVLFFTSQTKAQKKIFQDEFKDNRNGWRLRHDSNFLVEIKDGALHIEKFQKNFVSRGCLWYNKNIPGLNTLNNFSVTVYARFISGGDIFDWIDFQWGKRLEPRNPSNQKASSNSLYQLSFIVTGEVKLDYFDNNWSYFVRKDIKQSLGEKFDARKINKYEISQKDSLIVFKINDKEVLRHFCAPVAGNSIGFQQCLKTAWEIDKIFVYQDDNKKGTTSEAAYLPEQTPPKINYPSNNELKVFPNPFNHDLFVDFYLEREVSIQLSLIDMNGITLQQHYRKLPAGLQRIRLYTDVAPGSYILKLQVGNKLLTAKLLKQ